ncbi:RNA polymerase sigma factor RpoH [Labilithrix luteola]|uniref:RNA polymerase sigma factor n=1 Tax=Labilithrix luteola TaxID=1391654 RepID=A0A0K1Q2Y7_9BACT|nr:RNA polymerase factor sigma-32 [Labilithrix luteola]AKU99734.1 RNA polymerase sigma factor RpoH [Labilithrix luteola]
MPRSPKTATTSSAARKGKKAAKASENTDEILVADVSEGAEQDDQEQVSGTDARGAGTRTRARAARGRGSETPSSAGAGEADGEEGEEPEGDDGGLDASADGDSDDDVFAEPADGDVDVEEPASSAPLSAPVSGTSMERLDPMAAYLREIQRHPLLTPEETHELAVKFVESQDPQVAARLVTANLRLVVKIAYEYRRAYKNIMDLVQEGNIGLMQAVKRYDPYRGVKLSSYAAWWIRAYILRFILNNWRLVKLGTTQAQRKLFFNLRKKRNELQAMGIDPTNAEIAKQLNVPESDVAEMDVRLAQSEKSLDAPVGDADGRAIAKVDMIPSVGAGPEAAMADEELQALVKDKLAEFRKTLTGKDKDLAIFDLRLVSDDPLTLQDLGDRFGISRERVRQLEQRLLARLRDYLKREMGDATETLG